MSADTTYDRIEKYYLSNTELGDKDLQICKRLELVFALYVEHRHVRTTIRKYLAVQKQLGDPISEAQAYRDHKAAEKIFTPLRKYQKEFLRLTLIESAIAEINEANRRARHAKNSEWVQLMLIKGAAEKRIIEAGGIKTEDPNLPDFAKLAPQKFEIGIPPAQLAMLKKLSKSGVINLNDIADAEIIEE